MTNPFHRFDIRRELTRLELEDARATIRELRDELKGDRARLHVCEERVLEYAEFLAELEKHLGAKGKAAVLGAVQGLANSHARCAALDDENNRLRARLPFARFAGHEDKGN